MGTHDGGFYFAGVVILISSLLVLFLNVTKHHNEKDDGVTYHNYSTEVENTCIQHPTCNQ